MSYVEHVVDWGANYGVDTESAVEVGEASDVGATFVPHGVCGHSKRFSWCTLATGHAGPHEARGYGDRLIDSWVAEVPAEVTP